jgi:uncharacterized protein
MLYNVSGLIQAGMGASRTFEINDSVAIEGRGSEHAAGKVELVRTKNGILVRAHLHLVEPEACSRCLKPVEETVRIDFEEEFQTVTDPTTGESNDNLDPDAFLVDEQNQLDLGEAIRQYREVSLEMAPLCRPDCRGLCPQCGGDLNLEACDCNKNAVDSRWEKLAALANALSEGMD